MKKNLALIIAGAFLTLAISSTAFAFDKGDRVLGLWEDAYWYPATVVKIDGKILTLAFDDGDKATFDPERVNSLDWEAGDKVECRWPGDNKNYPGVLVKRNGDKVRIVYDDGDKADLSIDKCRQSRAARLVGK
ncbi:MAG: tudor domain-containing protein [Bradymonadales bacterium]|jgi:hypothetical protein